MAGFNAATVVEALDWTFEPFVPGAKGVIAEPNDDQITAYLTGMKALMAEVGDEVPALPDGSSDPADLIAALDDLDPASMQKLNGKMAVLYAELCSGNPSREAILGLPPRRRTMFYGWLQQEVMSPEAAPGGGSAQVTTLRSAAAG